MDVKGQWYDVSYWPGDSKSGMFGGNSNWRGPIWVRRVMLMLMLKNIVQSVLPLDRSELSPY